MDPSVPPGSSAREWPDDRLAALLGVGVRTLRPLGAGGFGIPYSADLEDGRRVFVKADRNATAAFHHEAWGLRWLAEVDGGVRTPAVLAVGSGLLVLDWVDPAPPSERAAAEFGRRLAITHRAGAPGFGRDVDSVIASEPLPGGGTATSWVDFYRAARLEPFLARAVDRQAIDDHDRRAVEQVIDELPRLAGPEEPPARLHGDLWSGNVLWNDHDATVVDPAAYGGHRETDLAMLALFGLPQLSTVVSAYHAEFELADGWQRRVVLHQLFPLLVHAVIFGGGYGAQAGRAARTALAPTRRGVR
jgi:fructosamine-3-kinase